MEDETKTKCQVKIFLNLKLKLLMNKTEQYQLGFNNPPKALQAAPSSLEYFFAPKPKLNASFHHFRKI